MVVKERPVKKTIRTPMLLETIAWENYKRGGFSFLLPLSFSPLFFKAVVRSLNWTFFCTCEGGSLEVDGADEGKG